MHYILSIDKYSPPGNEDIVMDRFGWSKQQIEELRSIDAFNQENEDRRMMAYFEFN